MTTNFEPPVSSRPARGAPSSPLRKAASGLSPRLLSVGVLIVCVVSWGGQPARGADQPPKGKTILADLGGDTTLELMSIPPGEFMSGSTPAERAWATGI